uniref:Putative secreted protein n=1 Tax=Anopheles darlingi TaxID=43151 RepID=A0A2M4DL78_ANODA
MNIRFLRWLYHSAVVALLPGTTTSTAPYFTTVACAHHHHFGPIAWFHHCNMAKDALVHHIKARGAVRQRDVVQKQQQ